MNCSQELLIYLSTGIGHPNFFNDKIAIDLLMSNGVPRELALNWGVSSCVMAQIPGACMYPWSPHSGHFSFIKCLELALYQGMDKPIYSGKQLGARTPDPRSFTNIDDLNWKHTLLRFGFRWKSKQRSGELPVLL